MSFMSFPSPCRVCSKTLHNYRGLASHLRHNGDFQHREFQSEWLAYRNSYHKLLFCRKCGSEFEVISKADSNRKRCPSCTELRGRLGKKSYEGTEIKKVSRVLKCDSFHWVRGDSLYLKVSVALNSGVPLRKLIHELSITYKTITAIAEDILGREGYSDLVRIRRLNTAKVAYTAAKEAYARLTPEEKSQRIKERCGKSGSLETLLARQLRGRGFADLVLNDWQSIPIGGKVVPREADIKVSIGDGRKVVILCDGEAFHGPRTIFGDPNDRISLDMETSEGYYSLGYSVLRYSESEIKSGLAIQHLVDTFELLKTHTQVFRNWFPVIERVS